MCESSTARSWNRQRVTATRSAETYMSISTGERRARLRLIRRSEIRLFDNLFAKQQVVEHSMCAARRTTSATARGQWVQSHAVCFAYLLPGRFAGRGGFLTGL